MSLRFAQGVNDYVTSMPDAPDDGFACSDIDVVQSGMKYFGDLQVSMLSLFMSIAGGVSWEEVIAPLRIISPVWTLCYIFYICPWAAFADTVSCCSSNDCDATYCVCVCVTKWPKWLRYLEKTTWTWPTRLIINICIYIFASFFTHMYIYIYRQCAYMYTHTHIYIYIYIHTHATRLQKPRV